MNIIENVIEANAIENVTSKQWITSQICTLEAVVMSSEDFIDLLVSKLGLNQLQTHSFIAVQQSSYLKHLKDGIEIGEVIVLCNFLSICNK